MLDILYLYMNGDFQMFEEPSSVFIKKVEILGTHQHFQNFSSELLHMEQDNLPKGYLLP